MQELLDRHGEFLGEFKRAVGVSDCRRDFEVRLRLRAVQEIRPVAPDYKIVALKNINTSVVRPVVSFYFTLVSCRYFFGSNVSQRGSYQTDFSYSFI